jgi:hypothetical protein
MSYAGTTPIQGAGGVSAQAIDAWMAQMGRNLAPQYAPDGQYRPPPPGLGQSIINWARAWAGHTLAHDLVAAQCAKESAGWQSYWARDHNNPAGLGVTGVAGAGESFATPDDGFRCQCAHLLSYAAGHGDWVGADCRADAMPASSFGIAPRWQDLNGLWATPGTNYGQDIARLANELVVFAGGMPMSAQIAGFLWEPADSDHYTPGRSQAIRGGAQHYTAGSNSLKWLTETSDPPVSATFLVKHSPTMDDRGWQLVRIEDTAWTTAYANPYTVSIEYEHRSGEAIPDLAYEVLAQTWVDITNYVRSHNLGDFAEGIQGHKTWVGNPSLVCPDGIDIGRIQARYGELMNAGDSGALILANNPYGPVPIVLGFRAWVETQGAARNPGDVNAGILAVVGYPMRAEYGGGDGFSYQPFERVVLQYQSGVAPPWDIVPLLRADDAPPPAMVLAALHRGRVLRGSAASNAGDDEPGIIERLIESGAELIERAG